MMHLLRKAASNGLNKQRWMSSGHGPAPTGVEAKIRAYLPHDHQIVIATLGAYATLFLLFKLKPSKKAEPLATTGPVSDSSEIPSIFDDNFDQWSQIPGNLERWEKSLETFGN